LQEEKCKQMTHYKPDQNIVKEPEVSHITSPVTEVFDADFNRAMQTAVSGDEFRHRMNQRIDSWKWNDK